MIIHTQCPSCKKVINADLSHKEVVADSSEPKCAAIIQCEYCRNRLKVFVTLANEATPVVQWTDSAA